MFSIIWTERGVGASTGAKLYFSLFAAVFLSSCASTTSADPDQWSANGYLTPGPTSTPELIGIFDNEVECRAAVDAWMGRQVVGNPIFGECLPVDQD